MDRSPKASPDEATLTVLVALPRQLPPALQEALLRALAVASPAHTHSLVIGAEGMGKIAAAPLLTLCPWAEGSRLVTQADGLLLLAGDLAEELEGKSWGELLATPLDALPRPVLALMALAAHRPVACFGVQASQPAGAPQRRLLAALLERAHCWVSEPTSLVQAWGLSPAALRPSVNPFWAAAPVNAEKENAHKPWRFGLCWGPTPSGSWAERELATALVRLAQEQELEVFYPQLASSPHPSQDDATLASQWEEELKRHSIPLRSQPCQSWEATAQALASCHLLVTPRWDAALLGALTGLPVLALEPSGPLQQLAREAPHVQLCPPEELSAPSLRSRLKDMALKPKSSALGPLKARAQAQVREAIEWLRTYPPSGPEGLAWALGEGWKEALQRSQEQASQATHLQQRLAWAEAEREAAGRLASRVAKEKQQLEQRLTALEETRQRLQGEFEALAKAFEQVRQSKWYRMASWYWRLRERTRRSHRTASSAPHSQDETASEGEVALTPHPLAPALTDPFDFLFLPIIDWDFRFQRPQQLACQLARRGHRCYYLSQKFASGGPGYEATPKAQKVWEVHLRGPRRQVYRERLDDRALEAYLASLEELRRDASLGACAVVVQLPFWWPLARELRQRFGWPVIYDCMDYHPGFSTNDQAMLAQEEELLREADLVVVTSRFLQNHASQYTTRSLLLPNACDYHHFAQVPWRPPQTPPVVGYYGAIADWFDSHLVGELARQNPQWRFLFVGSTYSADLRPLSGLANVELVGEKPYPELPQWLAQMDVLLIPFKLTPLIEATNPVKFFEIMAAGKPLVSVPLPELEPYQHLVSFAHTPSQFSQAIAQALAEETPELAQKRRAFAQKHTWEARVEALLPSVRQCFPLVSVVVVTYNNLPLTQACLESLLARTEWPQYELFVVDNASQDGTPEYLRELASHHPHIHLILNQENRGFAAANNQALRQARGEYLVLLNNDTVVTRGWLSRLVAHLRSHPHWGLVGPVTNWIGNEAQIPVGYKNLEAMPAWAEAYTCQHWGEWHKLSVAALFCAAFRRDTWQRVGELDERFGLGMFEDDDYSRRVREAGWEVVCVEDVFVHHEGKAAFNRMSPQAYQALFEENRRRFEDKWGKPWVPHRYRGQ